MTTEHEPRIWSGISDELPANHPDAQRSLYCVQCGALVHAANNENMATWVETGKGPFCLADFTANARTYLDQGEGWGLTE